MTFDNPSMLLLAVGIGAVIGILFGGTVMSAVHKLMLIATKLALLAAVVVIGFLLWNAYQSAPAPQVQPGVQTYSASSSKYQPVETPPPKSAPGRWWEQRRKK